MEQKVEWKTIAEMREEILKRATFPMNVRHLVEDGFGGWELSVVAVAADIDEYLKIKVKKFRVPIEDAVCGLAKAVGIDMRFTHVCQVRK